jgi:hypothetical protein
MRAAPTGADLVAWLGAADEAKAEATIAVVSAAAKSYTRGHGFEDDGTVTEGLWAAIVVAAGRAYGNPEADEQHTETAGPFSVQRIGTPFTAWTAMELAVLNDLRVRTNRPSAVVA